MESMNLEQLYKLNNVGFDVVINAGEARLEKNEKYIGYSFCLLNYGRTSNIAELLASVYDCGYADGVRGGIAEVYAE